MQAGHFFKNFSNMLFKNLFYLLLLFTLAGCKHYSHQKPAQFKRINPEISGVSFSNKIIENDTLNYFTFPYLYMGGGVAVLDINNDGLQDLFFTGNNDF